MEVFTSQKFRKRTEAAEELLQTQGNTLEKKEREYLEIEQQRGRTHRKIEAVTGGECNVFKGTAFGETSIAGFYDGQSHLKENILDDYKFALHVKKHEDLHGVAMKDIDLKKCLNADQIKALAKAIDQPDLNSINLMEGFTEMINTWENGKDQRCEYLKKEVPAALKLQDIAIKHTGISLASAFRSNNSALFYYCIQKLVEKVGNTTVDKSLN